MLILKIFLKFKSAFDSDDVTSYVRVPSMITADNPGKWLDSTESQLPPSKFVF